LLIYSVVRFRGKPGEPPPSQAHGNRRLEIFSIVFTTLVLLVIFSLSLGVLRVVGYQPDPPLPRLSPLAQVLYLFFNAVPTTILSALLVFATSVLNPTYAEAPRIFGTSAIIDQQIAGLIMWVAGGLTYLLVISIVFFGWVNREEKTGATSESLRADHR
jgi:cytochrome c oxidase assembly factor CtaG